MFSRSQDKSSRRSLRFCQSYCGSNLSNLKFTVFQSMLLGNCSVLPRTVHFQGLSCGTDCWAIFTLDSTRSIMFTFDMITNCWLILGLKITVATAPKLVVKSDRGVSDHLVQSCRIRQRLFLEIKAMPFSSPVKEELVSKLIGLYIGRFKNTTSIGNKTDWNKTQFECYLFLNSCVYERYALSKQVW